MIEHEKQLGQFLKRYTPILKRHGKCSFRMEVPSKTGRVMVHKHFTLWIWEGEFHIARKTEDKIHSGITIEEALEKAGLISKRIFV